MAETKDVTAQEDKAVQEAREKELSMQPAVDIFEDETGITVQADMPGVSKDGLELNIDSDSLSIVGSIDIKLPNNMSAVYADMRSTRFERSFTLSRELDADNIEASLKDGVLTLRIPKREEHKPRKIEIRAE